MRTIQATIYLYEVGKPTKILSTVTRDFEYERAEWNTEHPLKRDEDGNVLSYVANVGKIVPDTLDNTLDL